MNKIFVLWFGFVILLASLSIVNAANAFGVEDVRDAYRSNPESAENIKNWPQKAQDFCKKAQDNALKKCEEFSRSMGVGGWWVNRYISAKGTYREKNISVTINDWIVGKWDCPPHRLAVDKKGKVITQVKLYSEVISYTNSLKKMGLEKPEDEKYLEIGCRLSCSAWRCYDYNGFQYCIDWSFRDENGDGIEDIEKRTKKETIERIIEGEPTKAGDYYFGLRYWCEGTKIPLWQFWRSKKDDCKITDCVTRELPMYYVFDEGGEYEEISNFVNTTVLRVCCNCTCDKYLYLKPNFDYGKYTPLDYDPFREAFKQKSLKQILEEDIKDAVGSYNQNIDKVPSSLKKLFGNEKINFIVDSGNETANFGLRLSDGRIEEFVNGEVDNPTMKAEVKKSTIDRILGSSDKKGALLAALDEGSIRYASLNIVNHFKLFALKLAGRISVLTHKNEIEIRPVEGAGGVKVLGVFDSFGGSIGYTNKMAQDVIQMDNIYSSNAGIYKYPYENYQNNWEESPYKPSQLLDVFSDSPRDSMVIGHNAHVFVTK